MKFVEVLNNMRSMPKHGEGSRVEDRQMGGSVPEPGEGSRLED